MNGSEASPRRIRIRFSKLGKIRFTSHRDVARMWERALRRSGLPVGVSQGYNPHPLVSFGLALPTGCESWGEYLDVRLDTAGARSEPDLDDLPEVLSALLPAGMEVQATKVLDMGEGSLQQEVASCDWQLEVLSVAGEELMERIERVLAAPSLPIQRERKGRQIEDDVRPAILTLALDPSTGPGQDHPIGRLRASLATHPRGVRPGDLVAAMGTDVVLARARRTHQWIERGGARFEPLPVDGGGSGPAVTHAVGRAS